MRTLPLAARLYVIALWGVAAILIGFTLFHSSMLLEQIPLLLLWLTLFVLADYFEIGFENRDGNRVLMTVADTPTIFLLANAGSHGVLVVLIGSLIVDALRQRIWYKCLFNAVVRAITYLAMFLVYTL